MSSLSYDTRELLQSNLTNQQLVSLILGTTVANLSIRDLKDNVVFSLQNTTTITVRIVSLICSTATFTVRFLTDFFFFFISTGKSDLCFLGL